LRLVRLPFFFFFETHKSRLYLFLFVSIKIGKQKPRETEKIRRKKGLQIPSRSGIEKEIEGLKGKRRNDSPPKVASPVANPEKRAAPPGPPKAPEAATF
jgi:hypothetical protein